jgi:hypothetical protein
VELGNPGETYESGESFERGLEADMQCKAENRLKRKGGEVK